MTECSVRQFFEFSVTHPSIRVRTEIRRGFADSNGSLHRLADVDGRPRACPNLDAPGAQFNKFDLSLGDLASIASDRLQCSCLRAGDLELTWFDSVESASITSAFARYAARSRIAARFEQMVRPELVGSVTMFLHELRIGDFYTSPSPQPAQAGSAFADVAAVEQRLFTDVYASAKKADAGLLAEALENEIASSLRVKASDRTTGHVLITQAGQRRARSLALLKAVRAFALDDLGRSLLVPDWTVPWFERKTGCGSRRVVEQIEVALDGATSDVQVTGDELGAAFVTGLGPLPLRAAAAVYSSMHDGTGTAERSAGHAVELAVLALGGTVSRNRML